MTVLSTRPSRSSNTLALYRRHFGSGRAAVGAFLGGMAETESQGPWVHTDDGRRFLDFGGYGVFILGHRHPDVVRAVRRQIDTHPLATRVFLEPVAARAAAALARHTPPGLNHVHFVNSGTEATEAALKLARAHGHDRLVTTRNGYHGKTLGALSVTANPTYQDPFRPLLPDTTQVEFGDAAALRKVLEEHGKRCCVILEPVQGEGGVRVPPDGYLREVGALCREHGAFLVVDEVQTGLGRLGAWWGVDGQCVAPDALLAGKGLSGGVVPVAAMVAGADAYRPFGRDPYLHTSTFGASPIACSAALAAVEVIERDDVPGTAARLGAHLLAGVREACAPYLGELVTEVRGRGLLLGIEFAREQAVGELVLSLTARGVLVNHSLNSTRVLRLTPPAVVGEDEIAFFLTELTGALRDAAARLRSPSS
ncbi:aminotransferase class III-fold pyridoxal phosphate-dependent enzyme [Streptomyces sp. DSM 42041]|uniref:Aminotransferase class III-fold pyridoxal phosphate-dependent enzyme n=1 Tax=Streptomyces hazeniae TaxID=3075538 RepID=A0ABU2NU83_9ACTN|nr:aminotransferase class III-fold pyridoxal phosphate-dependent enzyme [Streptomyces sp. DSM 42041]MDT0380547.1 aminotransferase class III-fold pyridoxal phosphate-dependent enzyme [Streptomyces sp. DSM 42041]